MYLLTQKTQEEDEKLVEKQFALELEPEIQFSHIESLVKFIKKADSVFYKKKDQ